MALRKAATAETASVIITKPAITQSQEVSLAQAEAIHEAAKKYAAKASKGALLNKEDYWTRKEERDIQRDKDMAWSGFAQAALNSVGIIQYNIKGTMDGLLELVADVADKLVERRNKSTK